LIVVVHEGPISALIPQGVKSIAAVAPTSFRKARLLA
jgi:hypothetical protein